MDSYPNQTADRPVESLDVAARVDLHSYLTRISATLAEAEIVLERAADSLDGPRVVPEEAASAPGALGRLEHIASKADRVAFLAHTIQTQIGEA
jgi:hypothetical protein